MKAKSLLIFLVMAVMLISSVSAAGLSIQLKRTNPGIACEKSAELIFDVINTEFNSKLEGFLWCKSPDDVKISSSLGIASGSGGQVISERFYMDTGPSQKYITLIIETNTPGDKDAGCFLKYSPYTETLTQGEAKTIDVSYDGTIGLTETDVSGYKIKLAGFTPAVEAKMNAETNETIEAKPAKAKISVNGIPKEITVGNKATVSGLNIEVVSATEESADVKITGKVSSTSSGSIVRQYKKMNGQLVSSLTDEEYREIRLDKTVPFAEGKCTNGTDDTKTTDDTPPPPPPIPWIYIIGAIAVIAIVVVYLVGKTSRHN